MPDTSSLIRIIAGESIFGIDVDSKIRRASNCMSARLMIELFSRCDDSIPDWQVEFVESLSNLTLGDPTALIGFDDGRWQGFETDDEGESSHITESTTTHYLKLTFRNEDAAYYQFPLFPSMDQPFLCGGSRKRDGQFQHVRVDLSDSRDLQLFIEDLRSNPHLIAVEKSTEDIFMAAPSNAV